MKAQRFNDLFLDNSFHKYVTSILKSIYTQHKNIFQDNAIDFEDVEQECWLSLYEKTDDNKDKNYCTTVIKNAAIDILRSLNKDIVFTDFEGTGL
jgi:DNA-directed RNA polymerase specialized sigma24 family protein